MDTLNNLSFIDLILGRDYAEIKGLKGAPHFFLTFQILIVLMHKT